MASYMYIDTFWQRRVKSYKNLTQMDIVKSIKT